MFCVCTKLTIKSIKKNIQVHESLCSSRDELIIEVFKTLSLMLTNVWWNYKNIRFKSVNMALYFIIRVKIK